MELIQFRILIPETTSMNKFIFLLFVFCSGWSENTGKKNKFMFVLAKYQDSAVKSPNEPPPPPFILYPYYADYNFIVDSTAIFYFQRERRRRLCGTGIDSSTPPDFINLKPKDLIQIPAA